MAAAVEPRSPGVRFYVQFLECSRGAHAVALLLSDTLWITIYSGSDTNDPIPDGCFGDGGTGQILYRGNTAVMASSYRVQIAVRDSLVLLQRYDWPSR
jgi:hypothetical protein